MKCLICGIEKNKLSIHILSHNIDVQDYYDKFLKKDKEGICLYCDEKTSYISLEKGYRKTCKKHSFRLVNDKYNVENISQLESIKKKKRLTCLKNHGHEYSFQSVKCREKIKNTLIKKYGVDNASKSKFVVDKIRKTFKQKYGFDHALQITKFQNKFKKTCINRFGTDNPMSNETIRKKSVMTLNKHYHCDYPIQSKQIRIKIQKTCLLHFNVDNPFKSKHIRVIIQNKLFTNYNILYPLQSPIILDRYKKTSILRYGVSSPLQIDSVKQKSRETCINKFGVDNYSKTFEFRLKARNRLIERIQKKYGSINPRIGINEFKFFEQLQKEIPYKLILNKYFYGYYPDARIEEKKIIIEFDEPEHLNRGWYKKRDLIKDQDYQQLGYRVIRVLEKGWLNNSLETLKNTKDHIMV